MIKDNLAVGMFVNGMEGRQLIISEMDRTNPSDVRFNLEMLWGPSAAWHETLRRRPIKELVWAAGAPTWNFDAF